MSITVGTWIKRGVVFQCYQIKNFVNKVLQDSSVFRLLTPFEKLIVRFDYSKGLLFKVNKILLLDEAPTDNSGMC